MWSNLAEWIQPVPLWCVYINYKKNGKISAVVSCLAKAPLKLGRYHKCERCCTHRRRCPPLNAAPRRQGWGHWWAVRGEHLHPWSTQCCIYAREGWPETPYNKNALSVQSAAGRCVLCRARWVLVYKRVILQVDMRLFASLSYYGSYKPHDEWDNSLFTLGNKIWTEDWKTT